jgi:hypothetical protein
MERLRARIARARTPAVPADGVNVPAE